VAPNEYRLHGELYELMAQRNLGLADHAIGNLGAILPSAGSLAAMAGFARQGKTVDRWFSIGGSGTKYALYSAMTKLLVTQARVLGVKIPYPISLERNDFLPVARWIEGHKKNGRGAFLRSGVSSATRLCAAAMESGIDISGTLLVTSGEGITPARRKVLEAAGTRFIGRYVASEIGMIGLGCTGLAGNSGHLMQDSVAAITYRRPAPFVGEEVNSLLLTSLYPNVGRIFINMELEDAADLVPATCGCRLQELGFTTVLKDVYSFGKVSSHGMTMGGAELLSILEEKLPSRFGGHPSDYQLVEQEGAAQLELELRVNPQVGLADLDQVQQYFMEQVSQVYGGSLTTRTWRATSSLRVTRADPYRTRTGKIHAVHLKAFGGK
jgi:hypothetical protein